MTIGLVYMENVIGRIEQTKSLLFQRNYSGMVATEGALSIDIMDLLVVQ